MHYRFITTLAAASACLGATAFPGYGQEAKPEVKADPAAVAALREAHDKRETFPAGFAGLTASITVNDGGTEAKGTLEYTSAGEVKIALKKASDELTKWAQDELESAFDHRRADDFSKGDGSNPITYDPDDHSPLGRQVALNDKGNSHYRIRSGHLSQVNRSMGPTMKFSITMMSDRNLPDGKYLPSQFTVTYFDSAGAIKRVDMYSDGFKKAGDVWVPTSRRVITVENGVFTAKSFSLKNVMLAGATAAAAK